MLHRKHWCWGALLVVGTTACAHAPGPPEVSPESAAYVGPKLIGCSGYTAPSMPSRVRSIPVTVEVKVQPDGSVDPGHIRVQSYRAPYDAATRAMSLAQGCSFEPAHLDEEAVEGRASVRFHFRVS
jgi:hypothetical protein